MQHLTVHDHVQVSLILGRAEFMVERGEVLPGLYGTVFINIIEMFVLTFLFKYCWSTQVYMLVSLNRAYILHIILIMP